MTLHVKLNQHVNQLVIPLQILQQIHKQILNKISGLFIMDYYNKYLKYKKKYLLAKQNGGVLLQLKKIEKEYEIRKGIIKYL
jgi:hypothetical protein